MIPASINDYYKLHAPIYDATRWSFLFGRYSLIQLFPDLPENPTILDLGCGTGLQTQKLRIKYPGAKIIGVDQSKEMLQIASKKNDKNMSFINSGYNDQIFDFESFDLVVASYSLSMIPNLIDVLTSVKKHLKENGKLLVVDFDSTPLLWFKKWMHQNHVFFDNNLFQKLQSNYTELKFIRNKAYSGLYTYSFFLGEKSA